MLAPCLALSLGGGYVWMRHKRAEAAEIAAKAAEAEAAKPSRRTLLPGSKAPVGLMDRELVDEGGKILPGSKIGEVIRLRVEETPAEAKPPETPNADESLLPPFPADAPQEPEPEAERVRILPGSKSAGIIDPEDFRQGKGKQAQGNGAINRNNIDEVLNNPQRLKPPAQKDEPAAPQQQQQPAKPAKP